MPAVSLTTLRARVRELADMTGSSFVTDAATSLDAFINAAAGELHDLLIEKFGNDYVVSTSAFTTVSGTSLYALPATFYKLLGIDLTIGTQPVDLKQYTFKERNAWRAAAVTYGTDLPRYRLEGANFRILPAPNGAYAGTLYFVPALTLLVVGADTIDFPNGYEQYVIIAAAIMCLMKEESETAALERMLAKQIKRIEEAAENRDAGAPQQAVDMDIVDLDPRRVF